jgi:hypothetical protein
MYRGLLKDAKGGVEKPMGSNPKSPGKEPPRVSRLDPNGSALVPLMKLAG